MVLHTISPWILRILCLFTPKSRRFLHSILSGLHYHVDLFCHFTFLISILNESISWSIGRYIILSHHWSFYGYIIHWFGKGKSSCFCYVVFAETRPSFIFASFPPYAQISSRDYFHESMTNFLCRNMPQLQKLKMWSQKMRARDHLCVLFPNIWIPLPWHQLRNQRSCVFTRKIYFYWEPWFKSTFSYTFCIEVSLWRIIWYVFCCSNTKIHDKFCNTIVCKSKFM